MNFHKKSTENNLIKI